MLAGLESTPPDLDQIALEQAAAIEAGTYIVANELANHVSDYLRSIGDGRKVVIVAHSQGNLYANAAYGVLLDLAVSPKALDIIAVATPANAVAGGGPTGACVSAPCYTTLNEDPIWRLPLIPAPLPANTTNGGTCGGILTFSSCHGFVTSYLHGRPSGRQILEDIIEAIVNRLPTAGFTMTSVGFTIPQSAHEGETLTLTPTFGGNVNVNFAADRSSDADGAVEAWEWRLNGLVVSSDSTFTQALGVGTHGVSLAVMDTLGAKSQPVQGTIIVLPPSVGAPVLSISTSACVRGSSCSGSQGTTFSFEGTGFTTGSAVRRFLENSTRTELTPLLTADSSGRIAWAFTSSCATPVGTFSIFALDVASNRESNRVTEIITAGNCGPIGPLEITGLSRPIAGEGDTVAILGRNFGALPEANVVLFGGIRGEITGTSAHRLIAIVPRGATTGPVQVVVDGQSSNTADLQIYPRRAQAQRISGPFNASPATSGQVANFGTFTVDFRLGDQVFLTGDPNMIIGPTFSGLAGPEFAGRLVMIVGGLERVIQPSAGPIDLRTYVAFTPGDNSLTFRLEEIGGQLSTTGLALVSGPTGTGSFAGQRFQTADTFDHRLTIRFRGLPVPEGSKVAVTAANWFRLDGSCCNGSVGGTIVDGSVTPNDGRFRTFTISGGEVAVTYSNTGLLADVGQTLTAFLSVVPADANGNRIADRPLTIADVLMGGLDSASVIPMQTSLIADGVDRPVSVVVDTFRDAYGNRVPDGAKIALTAVNWFRRDGSCCSGSIGGTFTDGIGASNDGRFRVYTVIQGRVQATFSAVGIRLAAGEVRDAVISAVVADVNNNRRTDRPFAGGVTTLSSATSEQLQVTTLPPSLAATTMDNRSVITATGLTDVFGQLVPDGTKVALTAVNWFRLDGSCCNGSLGGSLIGGVGASNDGRFRVFEVVGGEVVLTYSDAEILLDVGQTGTAVVSLLPADGANNRIGDVPIAAVTITLAGVDTGTVTPSQASTIADGADRPVPVTISGIRDALGVQVPDGTKIAVTAVNWFRRDGSCCSGSIGGTFTDGIGASNDGRFRVYTVIQGRVQATFSAVGIRLAAGEVRDAVISAVVADVNNNRRTDRPFATGAITLSSAAPTQIAVDPPNLLADTQQHLSFITISGLTDSLGRTVPDGTKMALTAVNWFRLDGSCCNGSVGGGFIDGVVATNDGRFRVFEVRQGRIQATYTDVGILLDTGGIASAVISVLPADSNSSVIGNVPVGSATIMLAGMGSAIISAPATLVPGGTTSVLLSDIRDALGMPVPDGTRIALTAVNWFNPDGSCCNGSGGGDFTDGTIAQNDGRFRVYVVTNGQVSATFQAPFTNNVTSVISAVAADANNNRRTDRPFAIATIRITTTP